MKDGFSRFILALSIILVLFYFYATWYLPIDDAYISYRYARNLVEGNGLVYNIGERVEGYSNFLWTLLNCIPFLFGSPDPIYFSIIVSAIIFIALILLFILALRKELKSAVEGMTPLGGFAFPLLFGVFLMAVDYRFYVFINSGLETVLFSSLFFLAVFWDKITTQRWSYLWWLMLVLLFLTRADGFVFVGMIAAGVFVKKLANRESMRGYFVNLGICAFAFAIYLGWRWWYYNDLLSNTYYAKTTIWSYAQLLRGLTYTMKFAITLGPIMILALLGIFRRAKENVHIMIIIILALAYVIYIGGDWMEQERFFLPLLSIMYLFSAVGVISIMRFDKGFKWAMTLFVIILSLVNLWTLVSYISVEKLINGDSLYIRRIETFQEIGTYIYETTTKDDKIAVNFAGIVPFYAKRYTIDMTGLNDKHIASLGKGLHKNWDVGYVLSKKPEYLMFHSKLMVEEGGINFGWEGEKELSYHPLFQKNYSLIKSWSPPNDKIGFYLYIKNNEWQE